MAATKKSISAKVRKLKELEAQIAELQAQADEIKGALKATLEKAGADEMQVDIFTIRYNLVKSSRFDSPHSRQITVTFTQSTRGKRKAAGLRSRHNTTASKGLSLSAPFNRRCRVSELKEVL